MERYLHRIAGHSPSGLPSAFDYLTRQLTLFLGDNGMSGTRIALEDITAYPAYQRLTEGLGNLGKVAESRLKLATCRASRPRAGAVAVISPGRSSSAGR
ncbi:hypothetical protein D3C78_1248770 [compost metagenome]